MRRWLVVAVPVLLLVGLVACGGSDDPTRAGAPSENGSGAGGSDGQPSGGTESGAASGTESASTPFEAERAVLMERLDGIGVGIGAVPDDVRDELVGSCRELEEFVDEDDLEEICDAIVEAIEMSDPGRIDLVLAQLAELEED